MPSQLTIYFRLNVCKELIFSSWKLRKLGKGSKIPFEGVLIIRGEEGILIEIGVFAKDSGPSGWHPRPTRSLRWRNEHLACQRIGFAQVYLRCQQARCNWGLHIEFPFMRFEFFFLGHGELPYECPSSSCFTLQSFQAVIFLQASECCRYEWIGRAQTQAKLNKNKNRKHVNHNYSLS